MIHASRSSSTNNLVRKVKLISDPTVFALTGIPMVTAADYQGFYHQIALDSLPAGITLDMIKSGQQWYVERRTGYDRLYLYISDVNSATTSSGLSGKISSQTGYYANIYDITTQSGTANVPKAMTFNSTIDNYGFTVVSGSYVQAQNAGTYNFQFSAQFDKTNTSNATVGIWLRQNGINVPWTATSYTVAGQSLAVPAWNWVTTMASGDTVQIMWATPDSNIFIFQQTTQTSPWSMPGIPSVILTVTQL